MAKPKNGQSGQIVDGGGKSGKRRYGFSSGKKTFNDPTEGLQHVTFDYSEINNNKNLFVDNVKKLSQHISV